MHRWFREHFPAVRRLSEVADEGVKAVLTSTELESQFIVDGKHVPVSRIGPESEKTAYYSYKLRHVGISSSVHVSRVGELGHMI